MRACIYWNFIFSTKTKRAAENVKARLKKRLHFDVESGIASTPKGWQFLPQSILSDTNQGEAIVATLRVAQILHESWTVSLSEFDNGNWDLTGVVSKSKNDLKPGIAFVSFELRNY